MVSRRRGDRMADQNRCGSASPETAVHMWVICHDSACAAAASQETHVRSPSSSSWCVAQVASSLKVLAGVGRNKPAFFGVEMDRARCLVDPKPCRSINWYLGGLSGGQLCKSGPEPRKVAHGLLQHRFSVVRRRRAKQKSKQAATPTQEVGSRQVADDAPTGNPFET